MILPPPTDPRPPLAVPDAFDTLGLEPRMDLDTDELEARYLSLSRDCHPDFHNGADAAYLRSGHLKVEAAFQGGHPITHSAPV